MRLVPTWHSPTGLYEHVGEQPAKMYSYGAGREVWRALRARTADLASICRRLSVQSFVLNTEILGRCASLLVSVERAHYSKHEK